MAMLRAGSALGVYCIPLVTRIQPGWGDSAFIAVSPACMGSLSLYSRSDVLLLDGVLTYTRQMLTRSPPAKREDVTRPEQQAAAVLRKLRHGKKKRRRAGCLVWVKKENIDR